MRVSSEEGGWGFERVVGMERLVGMTMDLQKKREVLLR